jgi:hypothetical protein
VEFAAPVPAARDEPAADGHGSAVDPAGRHADADRGDQHRAAVGRRGVPPAQPVPVAVTEPIAVAQPVSVSYSMAFRSTTMSLSLSS